MNQELLTARMIAGSLVAGVVTLWGIGWFLTGGGAEGISGELGLSPGAAIWIWAALALPGLAAALVFRNKALDARPEAAPSLSVESVEHGTGPLLTYLIVAWALLEGPAVVSGVFYLLLPSAPLLWIAGLVFFVGMAITFPREEWFVVDRRRR